MKIIKVKSGMIEAIAYNSRRENLTVKFKSGGFYRYSGVPAEAVDHLQLAKSVGSYFSANIKNDYYGEKVVGSKMEKQMAEEATVKLSAGKVSVTINCKPGWPFPV